MTDKPPSRDHSPISRRKALGVMLMAGLAGCGSNNNGTPTETPRTDTATPTAPNEATPSPTASDTPAEDPPTDSQTDDGTPRPGAIAWETGADWDRSPERRGIVHGPWTQAGEQALQLGYPAVAPGLEAYYALNTPGADTEPDYAGDHAGNQQQAIRSETGLHNSSAYRFTNGYIPINSPPVVDRSTPITVAFWLRTEADSRAYMDDYMWHHQDGDIQFGVSIDSEGQLYVFTTNSDTLSGPVPTVINDGEWHHVAMVFDQANRRIQQYVDGELDIEVTDYRDTVAFTPGLAAIGAATDGSKTLDGVMDDFRWYSRALSPDEVQMLYQNGTRGTLRTREKTLSSTDNPNLVGLDYDLNGGEIQVTVFGDRGGNTSEQHRVSLDGATRYDIPWQSFHSRFEFELTFTSPSITQTPVLRRLALS